MISPACATDAHLGCPDESCRCFHHFSRHRVDHRSETVDGAATAERFRALGGGDYAEPAGPPDWSEL